MEIFYFLAFVSSSVTGFTAYGVIVQLITLFSVYSQI